VFSLRSARGRAILAGVVLLVLLAGVATLAVWGTRDIRQQNHAFDHTAAAVTALESAHAQLRREQAAILSLLLFSGDSTLLDDYHEAAAALQQHLGDARDEALHHREADELLALDDLTERIGQFNGQVDSALPFLLEADPETRVQLTTAARSEMWSESEAIVADLQELAANEQQELAAGRVAADRAAATTIWLLIGSSAAAFVVAAGTIAMLIVSVVRPLAALRASARAITSGDPEARAKVYGPEEVASLAHDFNEMTDALAAKTQEYIDTTNLTGDVICRMDKRGMWTFLNDAACQFYGKPREELLGTDSRAFLHPDDLEPTDQAIRQMRAKKALTAGFVNRQVTPMGTRVVEWNGHPLFDAGGHYTAMQITGRDITERKQMEEALRRQEYELAERAKELNCLYGISVLVDKPGISLQEILQGTADLIPASWQYPQVTCARIIVDGQEFRTATFKETTWRQASNIMVSGQRAGSVEVYYLDKRPESDEGPSLKEERALINAVSERLGHISERKRAQEALREREHELAERAKELNCLYGISVLVDKPSISLQEILQGTADLIPASWQYPQVTCARIIVDGQEFRTATFKETTWRQASDIMVSGQRAGSVEVYYLDKRPESDEGPFLKEERALINAVGERLGHISERKRLEEERERLHAELEERAITDSLTGLYNHAHFFQRLAEEIERSKRYKRRFAVVMMDVDAFKHYNDSRGHQAGDDALRLLADCIRTGIRGSDLAFRYGGDEFATILINADSARAQAVVNRINRHIAAGLKEMDDQAASWLGLSAGVASFPEDATTPDELVQMADAALYNAKRLAWARGLTEPEQAIESHPYPHKLMHETQSGMLATAAGSLAAVLQNLGVSEIAAALDLRSISAVGAAPELQDRYLRGHQERASLWAAALAEEMGLPSEQVRNIRIAGLLHDIGNVTVNEGILNKPGRLTEEEYAKVKRHAPLGAEIMLSEAEALDQLAPIVRHHHEHFGGKGYPDGLAGEEIPREARILAVADAFDAMTHERAYRKAMSREEAIAELERGAGTQFDPEVVKAFLALVKKRDQEATASAQAERRDRRLASARVAAGKKG